MLRVTDASCKFQDFQPFLHWCFQIPLGSTVSMSARLDMAGLSFSNADAAGSRAGEVGAATCATWQPIFGRIPFQLAIQSDSSAARCIRFFWFFCLFCFSSTPCCSHLLKSTPLWRRPPAPPKRTVEQMLTMIQAAVGCFLQTSAVKNDGCQWKTSCKVHVKSDATY